MKLVNKFKTFINPLNIIWAICGGDAIDMFVNGQTRNHKDLDVAVFWENRDEIITFMLNNNWRVFEPANGPLREITDLSNDYKRKSNIWCLSRNNKSYSIKHINDNYYRIDCNTKNQTELDFVEFLFNTQKDKFFLYQKDFSINIPLNKAIQFNQDNIPYLTPEVVLLYKASFVKHLDTSKKYLQNMIRDYRHDFDTAIPKMDKDQLNWLYNSLVKTYKDGHEWIDKIRLQLSISLL